MHFAHIVVLTIYLISIIYITDMLPQHPVNIKEFHECSEVTLARNNLGP